MILNTSSCDFLLSNLLNEFQAARDVVRRYLLGFRLAATGIYEECTGKSKHGDCLPTLLQILYHMEPFKYEIETIASIYKVINQGR